ncbi:hypothetical protein [Bacillus sp. TH13]|uniref:hypothetical protein n=1 Tax=Bacillus sp. TH13 TaxID=2796379 RepID=UPI001F5B53FF|nr:hypothetical protein [Bacillus sp. TH13]
MNFKEYQTAVTRTFATGRTYEQNPTNYAMELCGEVGEVGEVMTISRRRYIMDTI